MAIYLIIAAPFIASIASLFVNKKTASLGLIALCASVIELAAMFVVVAGVIDNGVYQVDDYFSVEALGAILLALLAVVAAMASWYSIGYLETEVAKKIIGWSRVRQYFVLLHQFILAMFFAIVTTNPILMWIAIEATTLSTAFLISFYNKPAATEAAWKYLIINSVGLLLGFFGTLLILYPAVQGGHHGLVGWNDLAETAAVSDPFIAKIAFVFILIGYGTKVGLVPMHTWLPDAHSRAPAPISSLLSGILLNVAFFAVLRYKSLVDAALGPSFANELLVYFGVLSIAVAAFIIFVQHNYKRLLAYHSVEHMGIIALGFGFGGAASFAGLLHLIYHALAKSALFLSAGSILLKYSSTKMARVNGMLRTLPITSVLFLIGFLAMAGIPPFGIFITEFSILAAGISDHPWLTIIALFSMALVVAGIIKHVVVMIFGQPVEGAPQGEAGVWSTLPVAVLAVILIVFSVFIPAELQRLLQAATANF